MGRHEHVDAGDAKGVQGRHDRALTQVQAAGDRRARVHQQGRPPPLQHHGIALPHVECDDAWRRGCDRCSGREREEEAE